MVSLNVLANTAKESLLIVQQSQRKISGVVKDKSGETIIGANISVKGYPSKGTITDLNGKFELQVPDNATLVVSYVGYIVQEIKVNGQSVIDVILVDDSKTLEEVVVVGYGVQKKVNLSGSVESLKGENLSKKATIQTSQALQGMAPGVTITTNSGKPGSEGMSIRIRGIGTLNSNDPLVLVDGVSSSLDAVDPNDIENLSILKDAASASIYGSRAANGVVLITTKRGKAEKVGITYRTTLGITSPITRIKNASAWDYMTLYDEANANDMRDDNGKPGGYIYGPEKIETWKNATDRDACPNSDLWNETYKKSSILTQQYLGISGGTDKIQSNTSINYSWQDALIKNTDFTRYGIRSNNTFKYNKYLEFGADISLRKSETKDAAAITNFTLDQLMRQPAIYATRYSNGVWGATYAGTPLVSMAIEDKLAMTYNEYLEALTKFSMTITPLDGLRFSASYAPKFNYHEMKQVLKQCSLYDYKTGAQIYQSTYPGFINEQRFKDREDDINLLLNFNKSLGKHDLGLIGGFQYLKHSYNELLAYRDGNQFPQYEEMSSFDPLHQTNSGTTTEWALMSYFGRLNYSFGGKYLLEANVRYDGSSRFAKGHKWGFFPSFSGAWRFSSEEFMKNTSSWLSNGKLRASWGELGNQDGLGSNYPFALNVATNQYGVFGNILAPGYAPVNYALNNITWETTRMIDFGVDLGFFNNSLNVTFDWYKKDTRNILLTMAIPGVMGYNNSPKQNAGAVTNKGWDLSLSYNGSVGEFKYRATGIVSDVLNKITDLGGLGPQVSGNHVNMVGAPISAIYGYLADGYFSSFQEARSSTVTQWGKLQGGDLKYIDLNVNNKMDGDDRQVIGNVIPRLTYSLDLYGSYKGFELSAFFQGVGKRDTYMAGWQAYPFSNASTALEQHLDRWSEANKNPNASYPRLSINQQQNNTQTSTHWLVNGAYLRLKNLQLAYNLPKSLIEKWGMNGVRVFANGSNLLTVSNLPLGMDPESPEALQNGYPLLRSYTFGIEVKF
jgi:Outer membrane receptor for ferrienterochelin and colicins